MLHDFGSFPERISIGDRINFGRCGIYSVQSDHLNNTNGRNYEIFEMLGFTRRRHLICESWYGALAAVSDSNHFPEWRDQHRDELPSVLIAVVHKLMRGAMAVHDNPSREGTLQILYRGEILRAQHGQLYRACGKPTRSVFFDSVVTDLRGLHVDLRATATENGSILLWEEL